MTFDADDFRKHIPYYLTANDQNALTAELKAFSAGNAPSFFLSDQSNDFKIDYLQGDGWPDFELFVFESGERKSIRGMVFSNSCDVDPANKREIPSRIVFSPLVKLSAYQKLLDGSGIDATKVKSKLDAIRSQKTTNIFYLPAGGPLKEEYLIRLDDVHSMPTRAHKKQSKWFTLSQFGHYLLVMKLSVHFCRLQENVRRRG